MRLSWALWRIKRLDLSWQTWIDTSLYQHDAMVAEGRGRRGDDHLEARVEYEVGTSFLGIFTDGAQVPVSAKARLQVNGVMVYEVDSQKETIHLGGVNRASSFVNRLATHNGIETLLDKKNAAALSAREVERDRKRIRRKYR